MEKPLLYRKRIIPNECILLKDDIILEINEDYLLTKWSALRPKKDLHHGYSYYCLKEGFKISKFYREDNSLLYWYCDIIEHEWDTNYRSLVVTDLLADVIVYPDDFVKVVDLDEIVPALESNALSQEQLKKALLSLNKLLTIIYSGEFSSYQNKIHQFE